MNVKLNYEEKGQGFPLIMLHGNRQNLTYFKNQIDFFSKKYKVIAIDTRGHGRSPAGNAPCTIRQFADDLNDFMEQKNIEKAHILGFSDGGNTAAVFALNHSEKIGKLILSGANLDSCPCLKNVNVWIPKTELSLADKKTEKRISAQTQKQSKKLQKLSF